VSTQNGGDGQVLTGMVYTEKKSPTHRGRTRQLLFDSAGSRLLIDGAKKCQVLSLSGGDVVVELDLPDSRSAKWQLHPSKSECLLRFTVDSVQAFSWKNLRPEYSISLDLSSTLQTIS